MTAALRSDSQYVAILRESSNYFLGGGYAFNFQSRFGCGFFPIQDIDVNVVSRNGESPLVTAIRGGRREIVEAILAMKGTDVNQNRSALNADFRGLSALHVATIKRDK